MDEKTRSTLNSLFRWLKVGDLSQQQQLQIFLFLGVTSTAAKLKRTWLGKAPAHPEQLRNWIYSTLESVAWRLPGGHDRLHDFSLESLVKLVGPIIAVSQPHHWLMNASAALPSWGIRFVGKTEKSLTENSELADFLSAIPPSTVKLLQIAATSGRTKAVATLDSAWTWPLSIAVVNEGNELFSDLTKVASSPAYEIKRLDLHASASIVFVAGDIKEATRQLAPFKRNRLGYVVITGSAPNICDLIIFAQNHNVGGVIALGVSPKDEQSQMLILGHLFRAIEQGATLEKALNSGLQRMPHIMYGHPSALHQTSIFYALDEMMSRLSRKVEDALFTVQRDVPTLTMTRGEYSTGDLVLRLQSRPASIQQHEFQSLSQFLGELRAQLDKHPNRDSVQYGDSRLPQVNEVLAAYLSSGSQNTLADDALSFGSMFDGALNEQSIRFDNKNDMALLSDNPASSARVQSLLLGDRRPITNLRPSQEAHLKVWISPLLKDGATHATEKFPLSELTDESHHELGIAFIPLNGTPARGQAQVKSGIFAMSSGELPPAYFSLIAGSHGEIYRARILILHRNKVVQSLLFTAAISETNWSTVDPQLIVENDVKPSFNYLRDGGQFDLSLVLNHNDENQTGIIAVRPTRVSFREPQGDFEKTIKKIKSILWALNSAWDPQEEMEPEQLENQLRQLARHGNILKDALFAAEPDLEVFSAPSDFKPEKPLRLQVVEARAGSYLPVEFFYDFPSPSADARLCAKYRLDNFPAATCRGCQDRGDKNVICPIGFWGVSRVIERRPKDALLPPGAAYECSEPLGNRDRLPLTEQALLGASEKVFADDGNKLSTILTRLGKAPLQATCWNTWGTQVQAHGPSLLVAVAHTEIDPDSDILSLEISKSRLLVCDIEPEYVRQQDDANPVVLLLGCQTKLAEEPLQSAAARFKHKGAALVISTVATMRGQQAPACVAALIREIAIARRMPDRDRKKGKATVGMVMLRAKQKLLASGHAIGMCLTANGDAEWHF